MVERDQFRIAGLDSASPDSNGPPRKVSRLLLLWPLVGIVASVLAMIAYHPLDDTLGYWVGAIPCLITAMLINVAWRRAQTGGSVPSFFPRTTWLATGCLFVPMALLANGALDHSPVEQHRQIITRTILEHGRRGSIFYYVELTSWRAGRTHEKVMVSYRKYLDWSVGNPVIVETHRGALGIPLLVSVHQPD